MYRHRAHWRCWLFQRSQRVVDAANPNPDFFGPFLLVTPPPARLSAAGGSFWEPTVGGLHQSRVTAHLVSAFQLATPTQ